ncbi:MAG: hypothetical protein A2Y25_01030 [Candidatus Melainabacteria bacterium GWF2_37_15]|nr:MAG: hypothetical protein A2Y25_01030 [Candidatus Melainabacteria bacterium GWF2_37_15]
MVDRFYDEVEFDGEESQKNSVSGFWSEKVYIITEDYEIKGYVFMPKTGRRNRILSDILNGKRRFVAVKDAEITSRKAPERKIDSSDFIQLNLDSIVLIRPCSE